MDILVQGTFELIRSIIQTNAMLWAGRPAVALPLVIFLLRATDQTLSTVRMFVTNQGRRGPAWLLGLLQAILFISAISGILGQLTNPWNLVAYAVGYGAGSVLGITIDNALAPGHAFLRVVSQGQGPQLLSALRAAGRGVTELPGKGLAGTVSVLLCAVPRRKVGEARATLLSIDSNAFITVEQVRVLDGGWVL
ncbi:MAG: DUF5698 domain-containing protein [Anaerolineales bacterium]